MNLLILFLFLYIRHSKMRLKYTYRFFSVFYLIVILLFQMFFEALFVVDYYVNTENYAAHCVNELNPELQCNGSCQLHHIVDGMDEKQKINTQKEIPNNIYLPIDILETPSFTSFYKSDKKHVPSDIFVLKSYLHPIFRPPRLIS